MGDNITIQDIVARSVMNNGGVALKSEIVRDTGLKPSQVHMAKIRLVQRGLFKSETLKVKKRCPFIGFRMTVVDSPKVKIRMAKLLSKFD